MKYSIVVMLLFSSVFLIDSGCVRKTSDWAIPDDKRDFHIFILMGQSNMSGYGCLESSDTINVPGVLKIPTITDGELRWMPASHPLHNRLKSDRFGLGLPFAKHYLKEHFDKKIGLIPIAWGGAGIDRLKKGTKVYSDFLQKMEFAKKQGVIKGVLWHQGESDTVKEELADSYEKKLHQLISDIRADVGDSKLPFIVGNLAEFYGTGKEHNSPERVRRINRIKHVLRGLPQKVENTGFVESSGCTSIDTHNVHFDRNSYILLGRRYYEEYSLLQKETKSLIN